MKRIMMMVVGVVLAASVNAASANWSTGNLSALPATVSFANDWQNRTAYFFLVSSASYDLTTLKTNLGNGDALNTASADASNTVFGLPTYGAAVTAGQVKTDFANGDYAYGYAVIYRADGKAFAISSVGTSAVFASGANASLNLGGTAKFEVVSIVPEPTSMALLALGVAAVGLRRRFKK